MLKMVSRLIGLLVDCIYSMPIHIRLNNRDSIFAKTHGVSTIGPEENLRKWTKEQEN